MNNQDIPTATANEAGPSNHLATAHLRRLRVSSPGDDDHGTFHSFLAASSSARLPRAKPNVRFPWPPKGRLISRHADGDKIVTEREPLTSNFLREYANGAVEERRQILQRNLDLQGRFKTVLLRAKRSTTLSTISKERTSTFMGKLNHLFKANKPTQPRPPRNGENKENEGDSSDDDESGDDGPAAGGGAGSKRRPMNQGVRVQRQPLADLANDVDIYGEQDMDINEPPGPASEDPELARRRKGKQREVDPEDDEDNMSPKFASSWAQSSPKRKRAAEEDSEDEREVEKSIDISYHPSDCGSSDSSPPSAKRQRFESIPEESPRHPSDNIPRPSQSSSDHHSQLPAPLSDVASSSQWQGPLPSTPVQQTGQRSRRLPSFSGDASATTPAPPDASNPRQLVRSDGPGHTMVDYNVDTEEVTWAPGPPTIEVPDVPEAPASSPGTTSLVIDDASQQDGAADQPESSGVSHAQAPIANPPAQPQPPQPPAPTAGPSRFAQGRPNALRRHDTFVEGPVTGPWMIFNSSVLGTIIPPAAPPVAPAPIVQAPQGDHYPSPAPSNAGIEEGEDDEGLEYTDGEDSADA